MLRRAAVITATMAMLPAVLGAAGPSPGGCAVVDGSGLCLVAAADPARPGGPATRRKTPSRAKAPATPKPKPIDLSSVDLSIGGFAGQFIDKIVPTPASPRPLPTVLAQEAVRQLRLPRPDLQLSAQDRAYVGVPLWLWVAGGQPNSGPRTATATAGGAQVTATARLTRTVWRMGPPGAVVSCQGTGTPWTGAPGPSPDCGYTYTQRSLPERTNGKGTWPMTVTGVWQVIWSGFSDGAPVIGTQKLQLEAGRALPVGELQVLVTGSQQ